MVIDYSKIIKAFVDVLNNKKSREEISCWAQSIMDIQDKGQLSFAPKEAESEIWELIVFLAGIDLQDAPNTYLHNVYDIIEVYKKIPGSDFLLIQNHL